MPDQEQGKPAKERKLWTIPNVLTTIGALIALGAWLVPDVRQLLVGIFTGSDSTTPSLSLTFTDDDGQCRGQMIDFDAVEGDRVRTSLEPYDDAPDSTDLIWDTCDEAWNLTGYRTSADVARMGKAGEPSGQDCQQAVEQAPDRVDWAYQPGSDSAESGPGGDLGAESSFCIRTTGGKLVHLLITQGPTTRSVPVVRTTIWNP
ncbi:hypothetical protein [Saccharopolyspora sp. 5N708]|uniref:hypothetical protein n=1 Tax=Saccharopolyspora sp. 5N708 TaxID=3457424 RepID=UPI003FD22B4A